MQVIEDPVEIIDNERELKDFNNMDKVIKLTFKSEKSSRRWSLSKSDGSGGVPKKASVLNAVTPDWILHVFLR